MKRVSLALLLLLVGLCTSAIGEPAQTADAAATDHTAPSYDMKGQALVDLAAVQKKFVDLANAVPADKLLGVD